jgi:parallel beta-helix repeat protein
LVIGRPVTLALLIGLVVSPAVAFGATYYVRVSGDDAADGLTPSTAWRSVRKAGAEIKNAGDRVIVGPGTYIERDIGSARDGIEGRPVVFLGDSTGASTGDASGPVRIRVSTSGASCGGDCNRDSEVTVDELLILVNVALGFLPLSGCPSGDGNGDGEITIDEILAAVNQALDGCAGLLDATGFRLLGRHHIVIDGFEIVGATDAGVQVRSSATGRASYAITLRNVTVSGSAKRGLDINVAGAVRIEGCRATQNGSTGISVVGEGEPGAQPAIVDSQSWDNGAHGIFVQNARGGALRSTRVQGNGGSGIHLRSCEGVAVTGNHVLENGDGGILSGLVETAGQDGAIPVAGDRDVLIADNLVETNNKSAIRAAAGGTVQLLRNTVRGNEVAGIAVISDQKGDIWLADNSVDGGGSDGISIIGGASALLTGNLVRHSSFSGIRMRTYGGAIIQQNRVAHAGQASIDVIVQSGASAVTRSERGRTVVEARQNVLEDGGTVALSMVAAANVDAAIAVDDNQLRRHPRGGLFVGGAALASAAANVVEEIGVTGGPLADGIAFRDAAIVEALRNRVEHTTGTGIGVGTAVGSGADSVLIQGNVLAEHGRAGIHAVASSDITVQENLVEEGGTVAVSAIAAEATHPQVTVTDNRLRRFLQGGIFVGGASRAWVADNTVEDIGAVGLPIADAISFRGAESVTVTGNQVLRSNGIGIGVGAATDYSARAVSIEANRVLDQGRAGINVFAAGDVAAQGNLVLRSGSTGLSIQSNGSRAKGIVIGNTVGASLGGDGLFLLGLTSGSVRNNVVFSSSASGITLRSAKEILLFNNLVYDHAAEGIGIGTGGFPCSDITVMHNTVYKNGARGLRIDGDESGKARNMKVLNNILQRNGQGGIAVSRSAAWNYVTGFNVNPDGYVDVTRRNRFDIDADPLFVDPAGADGILGGVGYADDDFRLEQLRAGQTRNSPALDAGSDTVTALGLDGSTASSGVPDVGRVDIGYHYDASPSTVIDARVPLMPLYVRQNGDDANDGLDPSRALASIRFAGEQAVAGVTVVVGPGRYEEGDIFVRNFSGRVNFLADSFGRLTGDLPGPVLIDAKGRDTGFVLLNGGPVTVSGFHVTGAFAAGIQVRAGADDALIENNVVFSNSRRGIEIRDGKRGVLRNNLVYANGTGGLRVEASEGSWVLNNTVYANGEDGILIGGSSPSQAAPDSTVLRNIVALNGVGIKMVNSFEGYTTGFNVVFGPTPFSGNTPRADSDHIGDPLFVNPAGVDGQLGGDGFEDDDFRIWQTRARMSPAVDIHFAVPHSLAGGSTRSDGLPDLGPADAGYHYAFLPVLEAGVSHAEDFVVFVRAAGDDEKDGTTPENAVASIGQALTLGGPGAFIVVGPGVYAEEGLRLGGAPERKDLMVLVGDSSGVLTEDEPGPVILDAQGGEGPSVGGPLLLDGIQLTGAGAAGLRILSNARDVTVRHATVCGNGGDGVVSFAAGLDLANNLLCGNAGTGVRLSLRRARGYSRLINNTLAGNGSGIFLNDSTGQPTRARLWNNVVSGNLGDGITLRARAAGSPARNNLNTDGYGPGTTAAAGDLNDSPEFMGHAGAGVACPTADDYRVAAHSRVIDAGLGSAVALGLAQRSVRADSAADVGTVDLGYHYRAHDEPR